MNRLSWSRRVLVAGAMLGTLATAQAQAQEWNSYWYVEAQGGLQLTSTNAPMDKLMTPTAAFSVGRYFTPVVGARLHVGAAQPKSGFADLDKYYKWKSLTPDLDLMVNLSNLFGKNQSRMLNLILLGGVGLNYAWDNDELAALGVDPQRVPLKWNDHRLSHNLRAGLRLETNQSKPLGLSLEVNANSLSDRFNSKTNDADDWQFQAMLGLSWRFGYKGKKHTPVTREVWDTIYEDVPEEIVEYVKIPKDGTAQMLLHKEVFYNIRVSDNAAPNVVQKEIADFFNQYEKVTVKIVGYADKGTGNAKLNEMYARKRAETFKKDLVEKYNIPAEVIETDSKGDTVQPFPENDKNRCVIIDATGLHRTHEFETVEKKRTVMKRVEHRVKRIVTE
ncbi:MAG: outer membrane beta-barrel protein [Prevotella sp.]|nr:outer membrane beta-barrel protein [Prevotella sp.]